MLLDGDVCRWLGPYLVRSFLGEGTSGTVYRALDPRLDREVALKVLTGRGDQAIARFFTEARAIAKLRHRNVVAIHEVNQYSGRSVIVLELVPGGSLQERLRAGPLSPREAARVVRDLAHGVHAAHSAGILHRDVKPANVLLDADGTPRLVDFGLALDVGVADPASENQWVSGSPAFMAPEQLEGRMEKLGPWTDVWGLGALLHTALAGQPPFGSGGTRQTFARIRGTAPDPVDGAPGALDGIRRRALSRDPRARYSSAAEMAGELDAWLRESHERALEAVRVPRRSVRYASLVAAVALTALLALVVAFARGTPAPSCAALEEPR